MIFQFLYTTYVVQLLLFFKYYKKASYTLDQSEQVTESIQIYRIEQNSLIKTNKIMKTNRSNSFRLHRITKTHSLRKTHDSQYVNSDDLPFKLEAIHSINKGVKYNDLSFITGRELNKLRKQPTSQNDLAYQTAHLNMNDVRKKYDEVKKKSLYAQNALQRLKEQKQKYQTKQNTFDGGKNQGRDKVKNLQTSLKQKTLQLQITQTQKKVLLSIRARHNTDKVFYDQKKFDLEKQYSNLKKQLKIFSREGVEFNQNTDRTQKVYDKLLKQLQSERRQREEHLMNLQNLMDTKASLVQANQIRGVQIHQIAQRAMLDKNLSQKQWEKIFLTHIFLNKMLRNKIEREMGKFKVVQYAFKQIKTATGVNDSLTLVHKYLNKQQVYGQLLGKISENQKNIEILRTQTQSLLIEEKNLETQKEVLQNTKIHHQQLHDELKQLEFYQQKSLSTELYSSKIANWLQKQIKKFSLVQKKTNIPKGSKKSVELFKSYAQKLSNSLSIASEIKIDNDSVEGSASQNEKLVRIQPRKVRKNSIGEQIYDVDEQQTNATNLAQETYVVAQQRDEVLRNNQKFMKQIKKKRQQMKKTLIEIMEKDKRQKDKPKVAEVKKQQ